MRTPVSGVRMDRATRAKREPLRRRTPVATASLCNVLKRYTMIRLRSLSAAAAARVSSAPHAPCEHRFW
eukprot:7427832-Lingulodinium_polyedra.AAC.1